MTGGLDGMHLRNHSYRKVQRSCSLQSVNQNTPELDVREMGASEESSWRP